MGLAIDREQFDTLEYERFSGRLDECLAALERMLARPGFGTGPATVGAELELFLVDGQGRTLPRNQAVRDEAADPRVVLEIDRFNLELNLTRRRWPAGRSPPSPASWTRPWPSSAGRRPGTTAGS
jgi:hypothetical protein